MNRRTPALLLAAAAVALTLAGCAPDATPTPTPTSASPVATPSTTPTPTPTPTAEATLPTDCSRIGTAATRAATVDQLTLQGDGTGFVRPAPDGATLALGCDWFAGDATGVLVLISTVDAAAAAAYLPSLAGLGYACAPSESGQTCTMTTPNSQYPVDSIETIVSRGDVWIYMSTSNIDGAALLADLEASIWA